MLELRENEQKTIMALRKLGGKATVDQIVASTELAHAAVMRAALSLSTYGLLKINEKKQFFAKITHEGEEYAEKGLPERRLINTLLKLGGEANIDKAVKGAKLDRKTLSIALGWLRRKGWGEFDSGKTKVLKALTKKIPPMGNDEKLLVILK